MPNIALEFVKSHLYILLGVLCIIVVGIIYIATSGSSSRVVSGEYVIYAAQDEDYAEAAVVVAEAALAETVVEHVSEEPATLVVHIAGEVNSPGVVSLPDGSRVYSAIELAGGATNYADLAQINLAAFVRDAMQIVVPAFGEEAVIIYEETPPAIFSAPGVSSSNSVNSDGLINLNTATAAELQTLPGVGPALSQNIIDFRDAHGGFSSVEELINVPRIGAATLDRLRLLVKI